MRWNHVLTILRMPMIALVIGGLLMLCSQWLRFSPLMPTVAFAVVIAVAGEVLMRLYRHELNAIGWQRARRLLVLRLVALGLLAWIILEPTWVRKVYRDQQREVVVLWDESASMKLRDDGSTASRENLAHAALAKSGLIKQLGSHLKVSEISFARGSDISGSEHDTGWNQATDIASALGSVIEQVPSDQLAGVVLVTDGRHNRPSSVQEEARRFGVLDAPLGIVAVGKPEPPCDAAVLSVNSPDAMHLGDRMRVTASLKFDGLKGIKAKVKFSHNQEPIEVKEILVPDEHYREEVRFIHTPEQGGTDGYQISIDDIPNERFHDNNSWAFETSITEARTHVLLVDSHPRWEFRYLRNLFHARDKSISLQWVLTHPDRVDGEKLSAISASASRPFGESAATQLPESESEWRKFDVIIVGDLEADAITANQWQIIERCVTERGAMLVIIAGPQSMPHALPEGPARDILPLEVEWGHRNYFGDGGEPFRISQTADGRQHAVTRYAMPSALGWESFPVINWRHPVTRVKDGAEVLLVASSPAGVAAVTDGMSLGGALTNLSNHREREAKNALLVTRQSGHGKVACLMSDRTWRLREGYGDTYHHKFWSSLIRWGAGPQLRGGSSQVGIGTDQLTYTVDDAVLLTARLRDTNLNPVFDPSLRAEILRDGVTVSTVSMVPAQQSNGLHEGTVGRLRETGNYEVRLVGDRLAELQSSNTPAMTRFRVIGSRGPVEMADTTPDRNLLSEIATESGGKVVELDHVAELAPLFLTDRETREEIRETPLWDNLIVFLILASVLAAEWWLRRSADLP